MISIKNQEDIAKMREGGKILAFVLDELEKKIKPGINLLDLETKAETLIKKHNAEPSFKGYRNYPSILCTSLNEQVVHCVPEDKTIQDGDILSLDCGVKYKNLYTDSARTIPVGKIDDQAKKLVNITKQVLDIAIKQVKPENTIGDISHAIQKFIEPKGYSVVKSLVGHGVGYAVHEDPRIPNYGKPKQGPILKPGMTICIEPMVNIGGSEVEFLEDGWSVVTLDKTLSAHFEHTILVTDKGAEILTKK